MNIVFSKYCLDYKNNHDVTLFFVLLPTMNKYLKNFDETKTMSFLVDNEKNTIKYGAKVKNLRKEKNPIVAQFLMTSITRQKWNLTTKKDKNNSQNVKNDSTKPSKEGSDLKAITTTIFRRI